MQLSFTNGQFFDLFAACNEALWPGGAVVLWIASAVIIAVRLTNAIQERLREQFGEVIAAKTFQSDDIAAGRAYIKAYVEFVHFRRAPVRQHDEHPARSL